MKLATLQQLSGSVALGNSDVFFMDMVDVYKTTGKLMRVSKSGGSALQLVGGIAGLSDLITVAGSPYWTNFGLNTSSGYGGYGSLSGLSGPIATTSGHPEGLTWNGDRLLYFTDSAGMTTVRSVSLSGHDAQVIDKQSASIVAIAADKSRVYLEQLDGDVRTLPVTGGSQSPFAPATCPFEGYFIGSVLLDQDSVYWIDGCGRLWKEPKTGGMPTSIVKHTGSSNTGVGHRIALDATRIYWVNDRTIQAADKSTGAVTTIVTLPQQYYGNMGGIAVDSTSIYWTFSGALWCTRKP